MSKMTEKEFEALMQLEEMKEEYAAERDTEEYRARYAEYRAEEIEIEKQRRSLAPRED